MSDKLEDKADGSTVGIGFVLTFAVIVVTMYVMADRIRDLDVRIKALEQQAQERKP